MVKSVSMISWEFDPFYIRGGTAYAIRRLADQLTALGIETRVLLPDWGTSPTPDLPPLLKPVRLQIPLTHRNGSRVLQCSEFCRAALEALEEFTISSESDAVIAHSDEAAMFIILRNGIRTAGPSVFWLHSLYDPPLNDFSTSQRRLLSSQSLLASAVMEADIVVTSLGILKDARDFDWPDQLRPLQEALTNADAEHRVLTVESMGCLPATTLSSSQTNFSDASHLDELLSVPRPYVLFPGRPSVDKGIGIFEAVAERLRGDHITCVAVQPPVLRTNRQNPSRNGPLRWLPWLNQKELQIAMRNAACTVMPSITEGFGLAAAESISLGVTTLYQQVGGHHGLRSVPNGLPVSLTTSERVQLYRLWSELIVTGPDSWSVWARHEIALRPLIDKWVEAIKSVVRSASETTVQMENIRFADEELVEERWGNKLRRRIENGATF